VIEEGNLVGSLEFLDRVKILENTIYAIRSGGWLKGRTAGVTGEGERTGESDLGVGVSVAKGLGRRIESRQGNRIR
jgi:hypothetical protein